VLNETAQTAITPDECHAVFQRWLGDEYDLDVLDIMLCTLAAERLTGDPLWLLVISGPGAAKTETVQACAGIRAHVESTLTGDAALREIHDGYWSRSIGAAGGATLTWTGASWSSAQSPQRGTPPTP
jgi:hypothetical protein